MDLPSSPLSAATPRTVVANPDNSISPAAISAVCSSCQANNRAVLESVLSLAVQIAREGREGRKIGTLFVVGDTAQVLERSRCLILDPLCGHAEEVRHIDRHDMRETVKELAQLDGGFIVSDSGTVVSATRFFYASPEGIDVPLGLGTRHMAGASITRQTRAIAIVVSESSVVRIFEAGRVTSEIIPELWMLHQHGRQLLEQYPHSLLPEFHPAARSGL